MILVSSSLNTLASTNESAIESCISCKKDSSCDFTCPGCLEPLCGKDCSQSQEHKAVCQSYALKNKERIRQKALSGDTESPDYRILYKLLPALTNVARSEELHPKHIHLMVIAYSLLAKESERVGNHEEKDDLNISLRYWLFKGAEAGIIRCQKWVYLYLQNHQDPSLTEEIKRTEIEKGVTLRRTEQTLHVNFIKAPFKVSLHHSKADNTPVKKAIIPEGQNLEPGENFRINYRGRLVPVAHATPASTHKAQATRTGPSSTSIPKKSCSHCGEQMKKLSKCSCCLNTFYCSSQCQLAHWKQHKEKCSQSTLQNKVKIFRTSDQRSSDNKRPLLEALKILACSHGDPEAIKRLSTYYRKKADQNPDSALLSLTRDYWVFRAVQAGVEIERKNLYASLIKNVLPHEEHSMKELITLNIHQADLFEKKIKIGLLTKIKQAIINIESPFELNKNLRISNTGALVSKRR